MVTPAPIRKAAIFAMLLWASQFLAVPAIAGDFDDLVAAEKAFAADASARSTREAFLASLADDAVVFEPGPVAGKAAWLAKPEDKGKLEWTPEFAEISAGGDMGYTGGPWRYTPEGEDKPVAFGHYFTVWVKQADGKWKVLADHGVRHVQTPFAETVQRRGGLSAGAPPLWPVGAAELRKADLAPAGLLTASMVSGDFLRLRDGHLPDGRSEGAAFDFTVGGRLDAGQYIAPAGDMAVTWGGGAGNPSWLRVWRRPTAGDAPGLGWRLAVDVSRAAPPPPPKE
ncbi:YybH family protein [Arenimonas oryziterrae]|uniref:DUF4440 domain-containing protein n=1 Tax=Arenimonas oryziterrae DSM 21050 = YC6267 TaxID=1121015 RepID=A0A091ATG7_9GAMM|nr:nuclear transport factor 2 family protein [Arenimonas oryziterrae]KFN43463.1 hypothetical protein N789_09315 [Arenimonas oryziterrae DSM 21050 = YC6267]